MKRQNKYEDGEKPSSLSELKATMLASINQYKNASNFVEAFEEEAKAHGFERGEIDSFLDIHEETLVDEFRTEKAKFGVESNKETVLDFYQNRLDEIYEIVRQEKAKREPGKRVKSTDIEDYLRKNGDEGLADVLNKSFDSKRLWIAYDQKKRLEYNQQENSALEAFIDKSMPVDSPLWHNLDEAIKKFQAEHPEYAGEEKAKWYKKHLQEQMNDSQRKAEYFAWENKMIADFLKDHELDENFWKNPQTALAELAKKRPEYKNKESADHFLSLFNDAVEAYNKKETADFNNFLRTAMPLTSPLWDDLDKAVAEFQKIDPRYQGKRTADWYKDQLAGLKKDREKEYNLKEDAALNKFLEQVVRTNPKLLEDPNALVAQFQSAHKEYSASHKTSHYLKHLAQWKKENADAFFARENAAIANFLGQITPSELDNPQAALARYQNETEFKTEKNGQWFSEKLAAHTVEFRASQNQQYRQLAAQVGDPVIAGAMIKSFESTQSFALRHRYLTPGDSESIQTKVAEYAPLVAKIKEIEKQVKSKAEASKELRAKLELAQQRYQSGKAQYDTTFYSPRAYSEYLGTLLESSDQLIEQEALPEISSKSFKDVPDLPKKELTYEEFRDELKGRKFYKLHPLAFKNKNVREAIREKTSALHKQWLLARQDFLSSQKSAKEREEFQTVERARINISRARLSDIKGLPAAEMKYEDFKNLIKSQNVYRLAPEQAADPKVRRIMRERNEALLNDHNRLVASNIRTAISDIRTKDLEHRINPEDVPLGSYAQFRDYLKSQKVYDSIDPALMKNEEVRKAALTQNQSLYQKLKLRLLGQGKVEEVSEADVENMHQATIESIDHFGSHIDLSKAKITDYAGFEKAFLEANPEHKSHFFDRAAYRTLLKTQWQDLQAKDKLAAEKSTDTTDEVLAETDPNEELKEKVPGHYMIKWNDLDKRLAPSKQAKGLERFNKLLNRSESGLQTLMQHFHQPLGTFVIEALAVAPQERVDRIFNALKDKPIKPGNREQASDWLKTFTETIGVSFLQKETTAGFAALKQNYQTFFGESLIAKWDIEDLPEEESPTEEVAPSLDLQDSVDLVDEEENIPPQDQSAQDEDEEESDLPPAEGEVLESPDLDLPTFTDEIPEVESELSDEIDLAPITADQEAPEPVLEAPTEGIEPQDIPEPSVEAVPVDLDVDEPVPLSPDENPEPTLEEIHALLDDDLDDADADTEDDEDSAEVVFDEIDNDEPENSPEPIDLEPDTEVMFETRDKASDETIESAQDYIEAIDDVASSAIEAEPEPEEGVEALEEIPEPVEVIFVPPESEVQADQKAEAEKALQAFLDEATPVVSSESIDAAPSGPQELAPEMWQEISTDEAPKAPKKKASIELLKEIAANPRQREILRTDQEKFYAEKTEKTHFYPALFAEVHLTTSMTVEKFLQQVKSYCLLTFGIEATLTVPGSVEEISSDNAQTLFQSIADRLHETSNLKSVRLGFDGQKIQLIANQKMWNLEVPLEVLLD